LWRAKYESCRKITKHDRGKLQTEIEDMNLPNPVDLTNATGRIRISLRKEVLVGNSWITELNE
jgi:hypothetical protein